jgi:hypothetical protein
MQLRQDPPDFIDAQNDRQFVDWAGAEELKPGPGLAQGLLEEKLDGAESQCGGRACDVFLIVEIEEILAQFLLGDLIA